MRHECVLWARVLVDNAQGMEKGSLDTLKYLSSVDTSKKLGLKLPEKKKASSSPTDEGCPDQVAKRTTHMGDIS